MATGLSVGSVTLVCQFRSGIHLLQQVNLTSITQLFQANRNFLSTQVLMFPQDSASHNVVLLADLLVSLTSWIHGQLRRSLHKLPVDGLMISSFSTTSSQWMFDHKHTTSFALGYLRPRCARTSNTRLLLGKTRHCLDGFLIQIVKRCPSQKATLLRR